jgi:hypothetical protein
MPFAGAMDSDETWEPPPAIHLNSNHKTAVIPRSQGFLVTDPHSYQGGLPQGANGVIYVKAVGSAQNAVTPVEPTNDILG